MTQTVALQEYRTLHLGDVIEPQYDTRKAFWRSMKVFMVAYSGYPRIWYAEVVPGYDSAFFANKFFEYMDAMKVLYEYPNPDLNHIQVVEDEMSYETFDVTVGIKSVRGIWMMSDPKV